MNSINDIWNSIVEVLSRQMTPTTINAWFGGCKPVDIVAGTFLLQTPSKYNRDIIRTNYSDTIKHALYDVFSKNMEFFVGTKEDIEDYLSDGLGETTDYPFEDYTFDNFVVGNSNKFAHAAAMGVAAHPGDRSCNPLFIYGNSGLGKTHLMLAIGNEIHKNRPNTNTVYIKGDDFTNEMVKSIKEGTQEEFRSKYRKCQLFLVDDIQFIAGKEATQQEFFNTFEAIYGNGHQIVITCDRPPRELALLENRLTTRFEASLLADIQPPDLETRMAIVRSKAQHLGAEFSEDVTHYIAECCSSNVRQLEGVVKKLIAYSKVMGYTLTLENAKEALKDIQVIPDIPKPDLIISETANYFNVAPEDICSQTRVKEIMYPRQVAIYLIRTMTGLSLNEIGTAIGRDHSTVLSSIKKIEGLLKKDVSVKNQIRDISSNISSRQGI